ncbi:DUF547 domain-containing protein [Aureisphaera galaxeae]|uniref:DUF547 domain-containing protein n=1 Tax=Aureisphaera galaxeae TaxID=1538023 RepID=UPI00234FFC7D|nr:DUF547 domain-containing protein [Aureisphaera galaxeae]MDC8002975.1 DUF547 domain-containing protein [Aureisphaera galaxeae]
MKLLVKIAGLSLLLLSLQSCALFSAAGLSTQGQPIKKVQPPLQSAATSIVDHSAWNTLLQKHVTNEGWVNYEGFQQEEAQLDAYLALLSSNSPKKDWPVQELLAYYINLYNAHTVKLIVDNYPTQSIKDLNGPWTRGIVPIGKRNLSLGGIENGILRKMNEPRIHFAINCASISCPKLLNEAYTADKIEEQLDAVTKAFINGPKNELSAENPKLSSIFNWYAKDYTVNGKQDVIGYINQYANQKISTNAPLEYLEYDWNLNKQ